MDQVEKLIHELNAERNFSDQLRRFCDQLGQQVQQLRKENKELKERWERRKDEINGLNIFMIQAKLTDDKVETAIVVAKDIDEAKRLWENARGSYIVRTDLVAPAIYRQFIAVVPSVLFWVISDEQHNSVDL